jgi:hypothetical protein
MKVRPSPNTTDLDILERAALLYWWEEKESARRRKECFSLHFPSLKLTFDLTQKQLSRVVRRMDEWETKPMTDDPTTQTHDDDDPDNDNPLTDDGEPRYRKVRCSYPGCDRMTTFDPIYEDLCYRHIRADNE